MTLTNPGRLTSPSRRCARRAAVPSAAASTALARCGAGESARVVVGILRERVDPLAEDPAVGQRYVDQGRAGPRPSVTSGFATGRVRGDIIVSVRAMRTDLAESVPISSTVNRPSSGVGPVGVERNGSRTQPNLARLGVANCGGTYGASTGANTDAPPRARPRSDMRHTRSARARTRAPAR